METQIVRFTTFGRHGFKSTFQIPERPRYPRNWQARRVRLESK